MSQEIPLYTQTSYDWYNKFQQNNKPYAVGANVGINEYTFGRTTPNNKFIVASGLVMNKKPFGIEMVGGNKKIKKTKLNNRKEEKNLTNNIMKKETKKALKKGGKMDISSFSKAEFGMPQGLGTQMAADSTKQKTGGKLDISKFQTAEFGMPQGPGTQMAANSIGSNTLLKQKNALNNYSMFSSNDKVKAYNYYGGDKKKQDKNKKLKGGNFNMQNFKTPEFGINAGVGTQLAVNTSSNNNLLKQQKTTNDPLITQFGINPGVADNLASNSVQGYDTNNFSSVNWSGGAKEKKIKKKTTKKEETKKKPVKKDASKKEETKKKPIKKDATKKKTVKKDTSKKEETKKKTVKKDTSKKDTSKKDATKKKTVKKDASKKDATKKKTTKKETPKKKTTVKNFFKKLLS